MMLMMILKMIKHKWSQFKNSLTISNTMLSFTLGKFSYTPDILTTFIGKNNFPGFAQILRMVATVPMVPLSLLFRFLMWTFQDKNHESTYLENVYVKIQIRLSEVLPVDS